MRNEKFQAPPPLPTLLPSRLVASCTSSYQSRSVGSLSSSPSAYAPLYPHSPWFAVLNWACHGLRFWVYSQLASFSITCFPPENTLYAVIYCMLLSLIRAFLLLTSATLCPSPSAFLPASPSANRCKPRTAELTLIYSTCTRINVVLWILHLKSYHAPVVLVLEACPSARSLELKPTPVQRSKHKPN
jgi:hypothetical protein